MVGIPASLDPSKDEERSKICAAMQHLGIEMKLPQITIASAIIFFHRYFTKYTFEERDKEAVSYACLFLAGKVEESPTKLRDLIITMYKVRYRNTITQESPQYREWRDKILRNERSLLRVVGFDFNVDHPYTHLLRKIRSLQHEDPKQLTQIAWNFINDSLRTTLCIQYDAKAIAATSIYLAAQYLKQPLKGVSRNEWFEALDCSHETVEKISNQILDLYDNAQTTREGEQPVSGE